ncbi:hypothetical protein JB92DRAFT_2760948 [Gautieria morchelliformis]|nr:hypothetical protein JB92DRAFT_2760948 [Gautieria morchelliformis]
MIRRRQFSLMAAYAFTDYKAQGQTLRPVIIDIGNPPSGGLNAFNAYVAISRGRSREMVRLLWDFNTSIFTSHPNLDLAECDSCLERLDKETEKKYVSLYSPHVSHLTSQAGTLTNKLPTYPEVITPHSLIPFILSDAFYRSLSTCTYN